MLFKNHKSEIFIVFTILLIFITNYVPHTFLMGWDNLQTDLNPALGIKRAFFSVWQEYQSFGLTAGMGHAADLVRAIFIWILSLFVPQPAIRYIFHGLMILSGGLGILRMLESLGLKKTFAFLGALFYILNFGVIQIMSLPFEPFSVFFGLLPWEIWAFLRLIDKTKVTFRDWLILFFVNLIATPQAVAQQLFVVYVLLLLLLSVGSITKDKILRVFKRASIAILLILAVNSFWLLPQIYFLKTSGYVVKEAKSNQLATEDVFYSNKDKGNLKDFIAFNGFFYDRLDKNQQPLFKEWADYKESIPVKIIAYGFTGISLLGLFTKNRYKFSFILPFFLVMTALLTGTYPFEQINNSFRASPLINQIFRSPFTKFIIPYALIASYFFACGINFLFEKGRLNRKLLIFLFTGLIIVQALPAFRGNYFSKEMKVTIPQEYFEMMDYFQSIDKNKRIALLPDYTFWGWFYNRWGYNGSGFLWYGVEQPVASRTFDVWSNKSESYYWEVKTALESENMNLFEDVLEKYGIDFLVYDQSLMPITSTTRAIQFDQIDTMLEKSAKIKLERKLDFISIYKVRHKQKIENFVKVSQSLPNVGPVIKFTNNDTAYLTYGDYQTDEKKPYQAYYPFLDLTSQTRLTDKTWGLKESYTDWYLEKVFNFNTSDYKESTTSGNALVSLYTDDKAASFPIPYESYLEQKKVTLKFPKTQILSFNPSDMEVHNCGNEKGNIEVKREKNALTVTAAKKGVACFNFDNTFLEQRYGYIIKTETRNIKGQNLFFYVLDKTKEQAYIEDRLNNGLNYYILGPKFQFGKGFAFSFRDDSYQNIGSANKLSETSVYLMPYDELKQFRLLPKQEREDKKAMPVNGFKAQKINYFTYSVSLDGPSGNNKYVILNQAFDSGWKAYEIESGKLKIENYFSTLNSQLSTLFPFLFGKELKKHVLVNNWENGWVIEVENGKWKVENEPENNSQLSTLPAKRDPVDNSQFIIIFWPQYLEYLGFGVLIITVGAIFLFKNIKSEAKS